MIPPTDFPKAEIYVNKNADLIQEFTSALVIDDDATLCRMLCISLAVDFKNAVVLGLSRPEPSIEIINRLCLDLLITDINMPGLWGDKVIAHAKKASPTTFTTAMTGYSLETAYAAGKVGPDLFFDKHRGVDPLMASVGEGFAEAERRRKIIFSKYLAQETDAPPAIQKHWRERASLKNSLGYSLTEYYQSKRNLRALALLKLRNKNMTMEDLTIFAGHSSSQRLNENLADLESYINIPEH